MNNFEKLQEVVLSKSEADRWSEAVMEWEITNYYYSPDEDDGEDICHECACGKEDIKHIYSITNFKNGNYIEEIGSVCINHFGREDLDDKVKLLQKKDFLLYSYWKNGIASSGGLDRNKNPLNMNRAVEYASECFSSEYFSRSLLLFMYDENVFYPTKYNHDCPVYDYKFLKKMFNSRSERTPKEKYRIYCLMRGPIRDWLVKRYIELKNENKLSGLIKRFE